MVTQLQKSAIPISGNTGSGSSCSPLPQNSFSPTSIDLPGKWSTSVQLIEVHRTQAGPCRVLVFLFIAIINRANASANVDL